MKETFESLFLRWNVVLVSVLSQGMSWSTWGTTCTSALATTAQCVLFLSGVFLIIFWTQVEPNFKENNFLFCSFITTKPSNILEICKGQQHPVVQAVFWEWGCCTLRVSLTKAAARSVPWFPFPWDAANTYWPMCKTLSKPCMKGLTQVVININNNNCCCY